MSRVVLEKVNKVYPNGFHAVKDVNLHVEDGDFMVFVGPSGCGKTTTLRMIAGLETITDGKLIIGDRAVNDVSPKDRDIAMVFQNYALYPHKTVFDNMAFSLKLRKFPKDNIKKQVLKVAKTLGIEDLLDRKPSLLSGGQRQRVALGRAIVRNPQVFLMDEPLSNLDAKLRVSMRAEITKIHRQIGATCIYVTHDQTEAMTMGTKIVVMNEGVIQQIADPHKIYGKPINTFVAGFIGSPQMNLINCTLEEIDSVLYCVFANNSIEITKEDAYMLKSRLYINKEVILGIRPEDINIEFEELNNRNAISCSTEMVEILGAETCVYGRTGSVPITAKVPSHQQITNGVVVNMCIDNKKLHFFDAQTEMRIIE